MCPTGVRKHSRDWKHQDTRGLAAARVTTDHIGRSSCFPALCCGFKPTPSHVHTCARIFMHTQNSSVWVKSRPSPCGLVGFSNTCSVYVALTGILWSASLRLDWIHNLKIYLQFFVSRVRLIIPQLSLSGLPLYSLFSLNIYLKLCSYDKITTEFLIFALVEIVLFHSFAQTHTTFYLHFLQPQLPPTYCYTTEAFSGLRSRWVYSVAWEHKLKPARSQLSVTDTITPAAETSMC